MRIAFPALVALLIAGCGSAPTAPGSSPAPTGQPLSQVELKYRLLAQVGPIAYCDPDLYPLARPVTPDDVAHRLASVATSDGQSYQDILRHYRYADPLSAAQQQRVYGDYKQLTALRLTPSNGGYGFAYFVGGGGNAEPVLTKGSVDLHGVVVVSSRTPSRFACPICLAAATLIDTPSGPVPVAELRAGMVVWTAGLDGARQVVPVVRTASMRGGPGFIVHLALADGRELWVSPNHPLADGRRVGQLQAGDQVDGSRVLLDQLLPSSAPTYDLLPAGPTGEYWAGGVLLATTLN